MIKMICLILGGGAGTRLQPLTSHRSKPAVPVAGKYRLIDIPISNCLNSGVKRIFVLTQFNSASLNRHIKNTYHFDHFGHGFVDILAAEQTPGNDSWFQGTADAVKQSMIHFPTHDFDYILILSGDQLYQMDFEKMVSEHIAKNADLTIATIPVDARDAPEFGIMKVRKDGMIDTFIEKPAKDLLPQWKSAVDPINRKKGKEYLASMGIYIFNKKALYELFQENPAATDFGKGIIPAAIKSSYRVASYQYNGYWTDIGNIRSFFEANLELTDVVPKFNLFEDKKPVYTRQRSLAPTKIMGTTIKGCIVADGSVLLGKRLEKAVIGIRSRIGKGTVIKKAIIMGNDFYQSWKEIVLEKDQNIPLGIGENCYLENVIVDKNVRIGNNVTIKGGTSLANMDHPDYAIVDGIIVLKKNAHIGHNVKIGL